MCTSLGIVTQERTLDLMLKLHGVLTHTRLATKIETQRADNNVERARG